MPKLRLVEARIASESGVLVFSDRTLLAVLVYLDADFYDLRGQWHLEAGFNPVPGESRCFGSLDEAVSWIKQNVQS